MKGNCTRLQRYNGTDWDTVSKRVSISGPGLSRETVEEELTLDCDAAGGAGVKKKAPGTKEYGDIGVEVIWNPSENLGACQVETVTLSGTVTTAGNLSVTVGGSTSGLPITKNIAVLVGEESSDYAVKVAAALAADSTLDPLFTFAASGATVVMTRRPDGDDVAYGNDVSLSLVVEDGTAVGPAASATSANTVVGVNGAVNAENHHLFASDFANETATFWRIVHPDAAVSGIIVHGTVKELGEPSYAANETVKRQMTIEPTGEFYLAANSITSAALPGGIAAPSDHWGSN